jgi:ADP-heptose:LPS heptosyltransferase
VIDLELFSRFTAMLCFFSGARSRVGFASLHDEGLYRGSIINCPVRYNPHVHMAVNFVALVNTAMGKHDTAYPTVAVLPEEIRLDKVDPPAAAKDIVREKIRSIYPNWKGEKVLLFNVNASDLLPQRRWPRENYSIVAKQILNKFPDTIIVATGAPKEREYVQFFVDGVDHARCVNSAGLFKFEELVPLYGISTLMITNDSGPAHFSSVTDLKVFVIFGPETPRLYMPLGGNAEPIYLGLPCSPCVSAANHRKTSCETRPCITGIPTAMVTALLENFLIKA